MRKKVFNIISFIYLIALISLTTSCEGKSSGFFKYKIWEDNTVSIMGLTKEGKKQETIVIPTTIDGHRVYSVGDQTTEFLVFPFQHEVVKGDLESDNLKTVYLNSQVYYYSIEYQPLKKCPNIEKVFWSDYFYYQQGFFPSKSRGFYTYVSNYSFVGSYLYKQKEPSMPPCNLTYIFNYSKEDNADENNLDKVFFVDYVEDTIVNVIPPDPIREGYEFKGWYKEEDCINKWDFENDIVPKAIYDSNGIVLNETSLYALWEEI